MKRLFLYASIATLTVIAFLGTFVFAYNKYTENNEEVELLEIAENKNLETGIYKAEEKKIVEDIKEEPTKEDLTGQNLSEDANFVFVKRYKNGTVDEENVRIPEYFVGRDYEYIKSAFNTYEITEYTKEKVVFEKDIATESYYLLGEKDGYVQVFFVDVDESVTLKDRVNTPIETLSPKDQELLQDGIRFDTEEELIIALENYES